MPSSVANFVTLEYRKLNVNINAVDGGRLRAKEHGERCSSAKVEAAARAAKEKCAVGPKRDESAFG